MHDPIHPAADLYYTDGKGAVTKLEFRPYDLTRNLSTLPLNGSMVLYDKADIDPKKPEASLAASAKLPPELQRAIIVVLPAPDGTKPAYRIVVIDDSMKAFPGGESRILPLVAVETAIQAGERQLQFLDANRRVFIVHVTPGALQPSVTTIVDTTPATPPVSSSHATARHD